MAKKTKHKSEKHQITSEQPLQKRTLKINLIRFALIVVFMIFVGSLSIAFMDIVQLDHTLNKKLVTAKVLATDIKLTMTPTPTSTPTPTPTPTPAEPVYTGFCLNVPVLMYHHVQPYDIATQKGQTSLTVDSAAFDQQMGYLASHGYTTYFAEDLVNALRAHTGLASKSVVVTLDDGYDDNYSYAFPILRKYGVKGTLMVPTGLLGVTSGTNNYFNWAQLNEMLGSGVISVGNHTWSHYPMGTGTAEKDEYEISTAQKELVQHTGRNPSVFTYPYGTDATAARVQAELARDGFAGAYSTIGGTYQCDSFIYSLHRTRVGNTIFPAYGIY
jgi:peptidoglycan/xylan/chitin deacetylase (PgdA/CDA1 family)